MVTKIKVFIAAIVIVFLFGYSQLAISAEKAKPKVRIASKNYTESFIAANLMAEVLESSAYPVERKLGLGGTAVIHQALVSGEIDVYAEYTGTALLAILKLQVISDPQKAYGVVKDEYQKKWNLVWLKPFGFNDTYALVMKRARAGELGLKKISDIKKKGLDLRLGATQEFLVRADGVPGLEAKYEFNFKSKKGMDPGLVYQALNSDEVDVVSGFSTDGRIAAFDLIILEDDLGYFPPYYLTPIVRKEVLDKDPKIADELNRLAGKISEDAMAGMNSAVDLKKKEARDVAKDFLLQAGIIK